MALGSITIDLLLKTGAFNNDAKVAEKRLAELGKAAKRYGAMIGTAIAGGATAATYAIRSQIQAMDDMSKSALRADMSTEEFSQLAHAANLSDVAMQDLVNSMGRLARAQSDAQRGLKTQQDAFNKLGIAYQNADGSLRDGREVLLDFADAFQQFGNSPELLASGIQVFGRSFQNLIPLLANGREGLQAAADEADRLGITLSTEAGQQAEAFNDNLTRLTTAVHGLWQGVAADLLPDLVKLTEQLVDVSKEADGVETAATKISNAIRGIADAISAVVTVGEGFRTLLVELQNQGVDYMRLFSPSLGKDGLTYNPMGAWRRIQESGQRVSGAFNQIANPLDPFRGVSSGVQSTVLDRERKASEEAAERARQAAMKAAELSRDAAASAKVRAEAERAAAEAMRESERALDEYNRAMVESESRQLEWMTRIEDATALMEGPASQAVLTLKRSIAEADAALAAGTITIAQHSDYVAAMGHQYGETLAQVDVASGEMSTIADQAARNMQDAFADFLFDPFQDGLSGMVESFAETLRRLAAQAAASKIFEAIGTWAGSYTGAGSGWVNAIGGILDGRRASGGPAYAGGTFLVGENGPELLHMGGNSGTVIPNNRLPGLGSGGPSMKVEIINQGAPMQVERQEMGTGPNGEKILRAYIRSEVNRGIAQGDFNQSMRSAFGLQRQGYANG